MSNCVLLPWDSEFFGKRIGRVTSEHVTAADMADIERWAEEQEIDCLYFLASIEDTESVRIAAENGFQLVDLRLTFERRVTEIMSPVRVRPAVPPDLEALHSIARGSFVDTRFYRDPRFAPRADALYETWIARAFTGFADIVLVATDEADAPAGFVCCHRREDGRGEIGLTAVGAGRRGRGVGSSLVSAARAWFHANALSSAFVVTNGANYSAQRLYQQHGFISSQIQLWYHRWLIEP